jgi:predicted cobalt transporter CbtA
MVSGLLLRGLIAGILAGFLAASFSFFAGEPPLERALKFEASVAEAPAPEPEIVSRSTQRGVGLFAAHMIYGAAVGGFFSLVFALAYGRTGDFEPRSLAGLLAIAGFIALALVPELKYPANPPAIGASDTIGVRTALYFGMVAVSLLAMILATTSAPALAARFGPWNGALISAAVFFLTAAIAGAALPTVDEVPAGFPASVLWNFRVASLGARAIFWCALGLSFGAMAEKWLKRRPKQGVNFSL